jgi:hypothetical protein
VNNYYTTYSWKRFTFAVPLASELKNDAGNANRRVMVCASNSWGAVVISDATTKEMNELEIAAYNAGWRP